MRIKDDEHVTNLSREIGLSESAIIRFINNSFKMQCLVLEDDELGSKLSETFKESGIDSRTAFMGIFSRLKCSDDAMHEFNSLTLIGDGDCPECGGDIVTSIPDGAKLISSSDRDSEPEWDAEEVSKCINCNEIM